MPTDMTWRQMLLMTAILLGLGAGSAAGGEAVTDSAGQPAIAAVDDTIATANESAPTVSQHHESTADNQLLSNLSVSGYMDVAGSYRESDDDRSNLFLHEVEIDLVAAQSDRVTLAASAAYNASGNNLYACLATIGMQLFKSNRGLVTDATVTAGLFNPRFGIDNQCNASPTRKLVTAPLVVQLTHQSWLDIGAEAVFAGPNANLAVFAVNGFTPSDEVMQDVIDLTTAQGDTIDATPANAFGGRLGIAPMEGLEIGGSVAAGLNKSDEMEMLLYGADLRFRRSLFDLRAEYILHSINRSILQQDNQGYYVQPTVTFGRAYATCRYDWFQAEGHPEVTQVSLGAGYAVATGVELRVETLLADTWTANQTTMQLFAAF